MEDSLSLALRGLMFVLAVSVIGGFVAWSQQSKRDYEDDRKYGYRRKKKPKPIMPTNRRDQSNAALDE